jgi:hypothetical protein
MKLSIEYYGRFGNIGYQTLALILIKIIYGDEIELEFNIGLLDKNSIKKINDIMFADWVESDFENSIKNLDKNFNYVLNGFFQHEILYKKYMKEIMNFVKNNLDLQIYKSNDTIYYLKDFIHTPKDDYSKYKTIVHLRIDDYIKYDLIINPIYLDKVLEKCDKPILFIHEEPITNLEKAYIKYFEKYNGYHYTKNMLESYGILRTSTNIVCVNSTFSLLALLFNNIYDKVYVPINKNKHIHDKTLCGPETAYKYDYEIINKYDLIKMFTDMNLYDTSKDILLNCPKILQNKTVIHYPIFKNGSNGYMEEYFLEFISKKKQVSNNLKYIDVLWTNVHHDSNFNDNKVMLNNVLKHKLNESNKETKYFTVVQWDDGPLLDIPKDTIIFGACSGTIPLPLIYEDVENKLLNIGYNLDKTRIISSRLKFKDKNIFCSFVGSMTHHVRDSMVNKLKNNSNYSLLYKNWDPNITCNEGEIFVNTTVNSKFALAPRGYGRSSFRFFEILQLGTIPIYIYDDIEWLPYKEFINYNDICISIHESEIDKLDIILSEINEQKYNSMIDNYIRLSHYFTLEGMSNYILTKLSGLNM